MKEQTVLTQCIAVLEQILRINPGFVSVVLAPLSDEAIRVAVEQHFVRQHADIQFANLGETNLLWVDIRVQSQKGMAKELTSVQVEACRAVLEALLSINHEWADVVLVPLKNTSTRDALEHVFRNKGYVVEFYQVNGTETTGVEVRLPKDGKLAPLSNTNTRAMAANAASTRMQT